jgi:hypothetical protein
VVSINEFFGPVRFDGTNVYKQHRANIHGLLYLRKLDPVMFAPTWPACWSGT